jgi:hypothetical protein
VWFCQLDAFLEPQENMHPFDVVGGERSSAAEDNRSLRLLFKACFIIYYVLYINHVVEGYVT